MRKIYCKDCKFYQGRDRAGDFFQGKYSEGCEVVIDCVRPKVSGFGNSRLMNKDNDCPEYKKRKWWRKTWKKKQEFV